MLWFPEKLPRLCGKSDQSIVINRGICQVKNRQQVLSDSEIYAALLVQRVCHHVANQTESSIVDQ